MTWYSAGLKFSHNDVQKVYFHLLEGESEEDVFYSVGPQFGRWLEKSGLIGADVKYASTIWVDTVGPGGEAYNELFGFILDDLSMSFIPLPTKKTHGETEVSDYDPEDQIVNKLTQQIPAFLRSHDQSDLFSSNQSRRTLNEIHCIWVTSISLNGGKLRYFSAYPVDYREQKSISEVAADVSRILGNKLVSSFDPTKFDWRLPGYITCLEALCRSYSLKSVSFFYGMLLGVVPLINDQYDFGAIHEDSGGILFTTNPAGKRIKTPPLSSFF